jgi:hypothetical protein
MLATVITLALMALADPREPKMPPSKDNELVAGMHTHVLDDVPEDTDVFHALTRKSAVPEIIRTERFLFVVDADGDIKFLRRADEVLKE